MMRLPTLLAARSAVLAAGIAVSHGATATAEECLSDWGLAGEIVRREKLITIDELASSVLPGGQGQILKTTLCRVENGYVYRLVVQDRTGQLRTTVVPAKDR